MEYRILEVLCRNGSRVVDRGTIIREVWGPTSTKREMLRAHITALRKKLETNPADPTRIMTFPGEGYWQPSPS